MSMISAQIDELRAIADKDTVPYEASDAMYQAADTIWQLRDDLQRTHGLLGEADREESRAWDRVRKAEAEADRLREERDMYRDLVEHMVHPDIPDQLAAENAKLRELVRDVVLLASCEGVSVTKMQLHVHGGDWRTIADRMRELGVEVGG